MSILLIEKQEFTSDIECHLNNMKDYLLRLQIDQNTNPLLIRSYEYLVKEIETIKYLVSIDPRFDWKVIQNTIDEYYKKDNSLTGVLIYLDWIIGQIQNRAKLCFTINNKFNENSFTKN